MPDIFIRIDDPELASFVFTCGSMRETVDVGTVGPRVVVMCLHLSKYGLNINKENQGGTRSV